MAIHIGIAFYKNNLKIIAIFLSIAQSGQVEHQISQHQPQIDVSIE